MSLCRYCANLAPSDKTPATTWEPIQWKCRKGWAVIDEQHGCTDYEREPGVDDDMGSEGYGDAISEDFGEG